MKGPDAPATGGTPQLKSRVVKEASQVNIRPKKQQVKDQAVATVSVKRRQAKPRKASTRGLPNSDGAVQSAAAPAQKAKCQRMQVGTPTIEPDNQALGKRLEALELSDRQQQVAVQLCLTIQRQQQVQLNLHLAQCQAWEQFYRQWLLRAFCCQQAQINSLQVAVFRGVFANGQES